MVQPDPGLHARLWSGRGVRQPAFTRREAVFLENGIPTSGKLGEFEPRVYFGQNSPEYSIVGGERTKPIESDFPADGESSAEATADVPVPADSEATEAAAEASAEEPAAEDAPEEEAVVSPGVRT